MSYYPFEEIQGYVKQTVKEQLCDYKEHKEGFELDNVALNNTSKRYHFVPVNTFFTADGNGWKEINVRGDLTLFRKPQRDVSESIRKLMHDGLAIATFMTCDRCQQTRCPGKGQDNIHRITVAGVRAEPIPTNDNIVKVTVELDFFLTVSLKPTEG